MPRFSTEPPFRKLILNFGNMVILKVLTFKFFFFDFEATFRAYKKKLETIFVEKVIQKVNQIKHEKKTILVRKYYSKFKTENFENNQRG